MEKTMWPHQSEADAFYGDPRGKNGEVSKKWFADNIVSISPPWKLVTSWDGQQVKFIRVHKACAESLARVLKAIWIAAGMKQSKIQEWGMHLYGGGFNYRAKRGSSALSMHAYGCAVDFDPARNGMGDTTPNFALIPAVLEAFQQEGWEWGGKWSGKWCDGMHWQATRS